MNKKKWYQRSWVVALLLIYFFPVGIYLMWKHTEWKKGIKILITSIFAFYLTLFSVSALFLENISPTTNVDNVVSTTETTTEKITITEETTEEETTEEETTEEETTEEETTEEETTEEETTEEETTEEETTEEEITEEEITEEETYYDDTYYDEEEDDTYYGEEESEMVWITATGTKYHSIPDCGNTKSSRQVSLETAKRNYSACSKCW